MLVRAPADRHRTPETDGRSASRLPAVTRSPLRLSRSWLRVLLPVAALLMFLSAGAFAALETDNARSYWDGLWWSLSLMTTVGFVGAAPVTGLGKIISAGLMVFGFIALAMTTAAVASLFVREDERPDDLLERAFDQRVLDELHDLGARLEAIEGALRCESGRRERSAGREAAGEEP